MKKLASLFIILFLVVFSFNCGGGEKSKQAEKPTPKKDTTAQTFTITEMEPFSYCALEVTGPFTLFEEKVNILMAEMNKQGITPSGHMISIYYNNPETTPPESLKWEIGFKVPDTVKISEPLVIKKWAFKKSFCREFKDAGTKIKNFYNETYKLIDSNKLVPAGPPMEEILAKPVKDPVNNTLIMNFKLYIPVTEKKTQEQEKVEETKK